MEDTPCIAGWFREVFFFHVRFRNGPGVSMMVKLGQNLYSIFTTISRCQNCCSRSSRAFSFSMYSCVQQIRSILTAELANRNRPLR